MFSGYTASSTKQCSLGFKLYIISQAQSVVAMDVHSVGEPHVVLAIMKFPINTSSTTFRLLYIIFKLLFRSRPKTKILKHCGQWYSVKNFLLTTTDFTETDN